MAEALEKVLSPAPPREIGEWVKTTAGEALAWRLDLVHQIESKTSSSLPPPLRLHSPANPIEVASGVVPSDSVPDDDARWAAPTVPYDSHKEKWRPQEPSEPETLAQPPSARTPAPSVTNELRFVHSSPGRAAMVGAGVLLIAGITAMVIRWMQWSNETNTAATEAPAVHPAPPPAAESAIVIGAQRATPTGAAGASTTTTTQPASPRFFPVSKPTAAPATGGAHDECENPFTVDARGIRHPKPQCFKK
jgi:serine/threonine-protein kinase